MWRNKVLMLFCVVAVCYSMRGENNLQGLDVVCPPNCTCNVGEINNSLDISCHGHSFAATVHKLPNNTTVFRYVASENVIKLADANFSHLSTLQELHLSPAKDKDSFVRKIDDIEPNRQAFFAPLINLRVLSIHVGWFLKYPLETLLSPLANLQTLDLSHTRRVNISNLGATMHGLSNNTNLQNINLWNIQMFEFATDNLMFNLSWFLEPVCHCPIKSLNIGYNAFRSIYPGLIRFAPGLLHFDASHNMMLPLISSAVVMEVILHPSIVDADFSEQGFREEDHQQRVKRSDTTMSSIRINDLLPERAQSAIFDNCQVLEDVCNIFKPSCFPVLAILSTLHQLFCDLLYYVYERSTPTADAKFMRGIPCSSIPPITELLHPDCGACIVVPTYGHLQDINFHKLNIFDAVIVRPEFRNATKCFHPQNNLKKFDMSDNSEYGYSDIDVFLSKNVTGLWEMTQFNISNSGLTELQLNIGQTFPKLEILDISRNKISLNSIGITFGDNSSLTEINLSSNLISSLSSNMFDQLNRLEILDLSGNFLDQFETSISNLHSLKTLDLSSNQLTKLSESMIIQLNYLARLNPNQTLSINLDLNSLVCSCSTQHFLAWILQDRPENMHFVNLNKYVCINDNSFRVLLRDMSLSKMGWTCLSRTWLILIGFAIAVPVFCLITGCIVLIYRRRWWIGYQYFLARHMWKKQDQMQENHLPYDLFVSYSERDQNWVEDFLQPKLEDEQGLSLCLHHRDFEIGCNITDMIALSIEQSKKSLFILSPNFLASTWCHIEVQMAEGRLISNGQDVILLALLKPLDKTRITRTLKRLMETKVYAEWTEDPDGQRLFWAKIEQAVRAEVPQLDVEMLQPLLVNEMPQAST